jgi:hypothetical protein
MVDYPPATAAAADKASQAAYLTIIQTAEAVLAAQQAASVAASKLIANPLDPRTFW